MKSLTERGEGLFLVRCERNQEVGNDLTAEWGIDKLSEFTHLVSQLDHACSRLGLCRPNEFGWPLGIRKIVAVAAPMQTRPQTALLIAYEFGEFQPGVLEFLVTSGDYFPFKINSVHKDSFYPSHTHRITWQISSRMHQFLDPLLPS